MINSVAAAQFPLAPAKERDAALWTAAQGLEATFLAEMLKSTGLGEASDGFGGGIGEEQFASFMRQAQADRMVAAGGIGLAEASFESLKDRDDAPVSET